MKYYVASETSSHRRNQKGSSSFPKVFQGNISTKYEKYGNCKVVTLKYFPKEVIKMIYVISYFFRFLMKLFQIVLTICIIPNYIKIAPTAFSVQEFWNAIECIYSLDRTMPTYPWIGRCCFLIKFYCPSPLSMTILLSDRKIILKSNTLSAVGTKVIMVNYMYHL